MKSVPAQEITTTTMGAVGKTSTGVGFFSALLGWIGTNYHLIGAMCTMICTSIAVVSFIQAQMKRRKVKEEEEAK